MAKKTKELTYNQIINIRPHHLLCITGYQGYGYDNRFRENLNLIHNIIFENKDTNRDNETPKIAIVMENDDICEYCPNLTKDNYCRNKEETIKIENMDYNVIKKLNLLKPNAVEDNNKKYLEENIYSPNYLFSLIDQKIKDREDIIGICDNCSWESKCLFIKKLK
ncbi:MAG: DUF1284 domain-containing protein [Methanobacteriaceae archaeon]